MDRDEGKISMLEKGGAQRTEFIDKQDLCSVRRTPLIANPKEKSLLSVIR